MVRFLKFMSQEMYFLYLEGVQRGPYTVHQIGHMVNSGIVRCDAMFWCEGLDQWQPVKQLITPKSEIQRKRIRISAGMVILVGLLALGGWAAFPALRQGWKEQHQVEMTPSAAYWRARGVLREHLGTLSAGAFSEFTPACVLFTESEAAVVDLTVEFPLVGRTGESARWRVEVKYERNLKRWTPSGRLPQPL